MAENTPNQAQDEAIGEDCLTERQRLFVEAYTGPACGNGAKAAVMAGYEASNARNTAWVVQTNSHVQAAIAKAFALKKCTPEWTKAGLAEIAHSTLNNVLRVDEDGKSTIDMKQATERGAMGQIKEYEEWYDKEGNLHRSVKMHDRLGALNTLAKIHRLIVERRELTGANGEAIEVRTSGPDLSKLSEEELAQLEALTKKMTSGDEAAK